VFASQSATDSLERDERRVEPVGLLDLRGGPPRGSRSVPRREWRPSSPAPAPGNGRDARGRRPAGQRGAVVLHHANFVKAFNSVGNGQMVNPHFAGGRPSMFICGADANAKKTVAEICDQFGWDAEDMGAIEAARAIEPLCMLWCIPGVGKGDWSPHAFKLLR